MVNESELDHEGPMTDEKVWEEWLDYGGEG